MQSIKIFAPATVANVSCGFDILGFALDAPGDVVEVLMTDTPGIKITNHIIGLDLPTDPAKNTSAVALQAYLNELDSEQGFEIIFHEKILPGSGIGSSSASAVAGVFGANELLGRPMLRKELVQFAMQGERAASGAAHADNVAPCMLGGFVLVRSYLPLDIIQLPYPKELYAVVVHPQIEVKTADARRILPIEIPLKDAVRQWGNVAGLVAGLTTGDLSLIGRSLEDIIVEPVRSTLIPGFYKAKQAGMDAGALGGSISGSGPSIFLLCADAEIAHRAANAMGAEYDNLGIANKVYVSKINEQGPRVID